MSLLIKYLMSVFMKSKLNKLTTPCTSRNYNLSIYTALIAE
jgi:hypothetical protein